MLVLPHQVIPSHSIRSQNVEDVIKALPSNKTTELDKVPAKCYQGQPSSNTPL